MPTLLDAILALPVLDTHTHLNNPGVPVPARDFWDIGHYFWFLRELQAAGYPPSAAELPEDERRKRYAEAWQATPNTAMRWVVERIFRDLYGVEIRTATDIGTADAAVRATCRDPGWPRRVIERLGIRRIAVNSVACAEYPDLPGVGYAIPSLQRLGPLVQQVVAATHPPAALADAVSRLGGEAASLAGSGIRGVRTEVAPFDRLGAAAYGFADSLPAGAPDPVHVETLLARARFSALAEHGLFAQAFLGIQATTTRTAMPENDPRRIANLHGLFEQAGCDFELLLGCELNNLDVVQAALVFPRVFPGGLWWYNFRPSTYRDCMQYRLEALPACRCSLVASDARCIEWCYGKILLVKHLLAEFLDDQIARGWLDRDAALHVAREWLHDAPARRYGC